MGHLRRVDHLCGCLGSGAVGLLDLAAPSRWLGLDSVGAWLEKMIYTLHIDKEEQGLYVARMLDGRAEVAEFQAATISGAIRDCAVGTLPGLDGFHIWYGHVSFGATSIDAMRHDAETLAQRLVRLHSQFGG